MALAIEQNDPMNARPCVLFVDDEPNILAALRRLFRQQPYDVLIANSGAEGLDMLAQHHVDLIVSDMRMPHMSGAEFLAKARELYPTTGRILLTGYADMSSTIDAVNAGGISAYISKPWDEHDLTLKVQQALHVQQLEAERAYLQQLTEKQNNELKELNRGLEDKVRARTQEIQQTSDMLDLAYKQLNNSYEVVIRVFSQFIGTLPSMPKGHHQRSAVLANAMGQVLGLGKTETKPIYFASLLADLGKLHLPYRLMNGHVTELNEQDRSQYMRYPVLGEQTLLPVEALHASANIIRHHREDYNGHGAPDRLKKDEIPLGARILRVAKDFDELRTGLLLKDALSVEAAVDYITSHRGQYYDPHIVDAFTKVLPAFLKQTPGVDECKLETSALKGGMLLSRDLLNGAGMLLLTKGRVLSDVTIEKLKAFEESEGKIYQVFVKRPKG